MYISGIVLSGGNAKRMNGEKPFLMIKNRYLIENSINLLKNNKNIRSIMIVLKNSNLINNDEFKIHKKFLNKHNGHISITWDIKPNMGPLMGLYSGMLTVGISHWVVLLPCDMPFITDVSLNNLIKLIYEVDKDCQCIVPKHENGYIEPLFAMYRSDCMPIIKKLLTNTGGKKSMRLLIDNVNTYYVPTEKIDPSKKSFININYLKDLKLIK